MAKIKQKGLPFRKFQQIPCLAPFGCEMTTPLREEIAINKKGRLATTFELQCSITPRQILLQSKVNTEHTRKITNYSQPADVFQIPDEIDFFQSHCGNTSSRTYNEYGTTRSCTIGKH